MERREIDPEIPSEAVLRYAKKILLRGGIVAYPTETFYGLGADPFDAVAWNRLTELKGRPEGKAFPLILSDVSVLERLCSVVPPAVEPLARRFWPGPLTLVVPARAGLGGGLRDARTVAVRVSSSRVSRLLAHQAGGTITTTSANRSGEPPPVTALEVERIFPTEGTKEPGIDLLLDGGRCPGGAPSTIVDITELPPRLIRPGGVRFEAVLEALRRASLLDS